VMEFQIEINEWMDLERERMRIIESISMAKPAEVHQLEMARDDLHAVLRGEQATENELRRAYLAAGYSPEATTAKLEKASHGYKEKKKNAIALLEENERLQRRLDHIRSTPADWSQKEDGLLCDRIEKNEKVIFPKDTEQKTAGEKSLTRGEERRVNNISVLRELMEQDINSGLWPSLRKGKEGLLRFIWRRHHVRVKSAFGNIEYDSIRRKTGPKECKKLGVPRLPTG